MQGFAEAVLEGDVFGESQEPNASHLEGFLFGTDAWDGVDHSLHFVLIEGENQFFSGAHGQIMGNRTASGRDRSATTRENFERVERVERTTGLEPATLTLAR